jgi:hypothetical protein
MLAHIRRATVRTGSSSNKLSMRLAQVAFWLGPGLAILLQFGSLTFAQTQAGPMSKLPVIDKITPAGPTRSALTGRIQSLDTKLKVLNVSDGKGGNTAIFPLSKKVKVSSISGQKLKIAALTPGTNVIVYYEQHDARRTVQQIIILGSDASQNKKPLHSS